MSAPSLGVEAVAGATVTSDAILAAVTDCVEQAVMLRLWQQTRQHNH